MIQELHEPPATQRSVRPIELVDHLLRTDIDSFGQFVFSFLNPTRRMIWGPHYAALCHQLQRVLDGEITRLLVTMPPRFGKSELVNVALSAFLLGRRPETRIISASYGADLAESFQVSVRKVMTSERYRRLFPHTHLDPRQATKDRFLTTRNGGRMAVGVGGKITGFGGDVMILDDLMRAPDAKSEAVRLSTNEWRTSALPSRFDDPKSGVMIAVGQRLHIDDPLGQMVSEGVWTHLDLPLIEWRDRNIEIAPGKFWRRQPGEFLLPERVGPDEAQRLRKELGSNDFEAQYNQRPVPPGGFVFKLEQFGTFDPGSLPRPEFVIQSWDTALSTSETADYTACVTIGLLGHKICVLDVFRDRLGFTEQVAAIHALKRKFRADLVVVEWAATGPLLWEEIGKRQGHDWFRYNNAKLDKRARAEAQTVKIERGEVLLPISAPWLDRFRTDLAIFPRGKRDDIVDAFTQVLRMLDFHPYQIRDATYFQ